MLALTPPVAPMLARLTDDLPVGDGWTYEPKWDGFRCLAFRDGDAVALQSRNARDLTRYFPEVVAALLDVEADAFVLDGELVADVDALMARLHPAASRVRRLAAETPATYVAFDLLATEADLTGKAFADRRAMLERLLAGAPPALAVTPTTDDAGVAAGWLDAPPGGALDGVVAKPRDLTYQPGKRAMLKVKRVRTADCVVAGMRVAEGPLVSSLLLGVWDGDVLRHVGVVQSFSRPARAGLATDLAPLVVPLAGHPWERGFALEGGHTGRLLGAGGRWTPDLSMDWVPLRPERVAEVSYTVIDGLRFRHPAQLVRWRPDRDPRSCLAEQLA